MKNASAHINQNAMYRFSVRPFSQSLTTLYNITLGLDNDYPFFQPAIGNAIPQMYGMYTPMDICTIIAYNTKHASVLGDDNIKLNLITYVKNL